MPELQTLLTGLQPVVAELQSVGNVLKDFGFTVAVGLILGWWFKRERRIRSLTAWKMYRDDLHQFAKESVDVLTDAETLCEADPSKSPDEFWKRRNEIIGKVSALRDRGKFTFPNALQDMERRSGMMPSPEPDNRYSTA